MRREELHKELFENASLGIGFFDRKANVIAFNSIAAKNMGGKPDDFSGKSLIDLFGEKEGEIYRRRVLEATESDSVQEYEDLVNMPDGQRWFLSSFTRVANSSGEIVGVQVISTDLTERKQAEEVQRRIQHLEKIGTLAAGIAHDFNNILMGVFGNIGIAKGKVAEHHAAFPPLERAEKALERAVRLTDQLLTFAKGGDPIKTVVLLSGLVEDEVRFNLSGSNVRPVFETDHGLWACSVDGGQMQQTFANLSINAREAMPDGGDLLVCCRNALIEDGDVAGLNGGRYVEIVFRDEGVGVAAEHLDRIFDPYFSTKDPGSGLGLATAYSVTLKHGGHISVESPPGEGAIFTLYLPAIHAEQAEQVVPGAGEVLDIVGTGRVLLLDDEPMIREVATEWLESLGYTVETVSAGVDAVKRYAQAKDSSKPFDVVITDLTIPGGMGGKRVIRNLLSLDPDVCAIVSSGYADDPVMAEYPKYGFKAAIQKPYSCSELQHVLTRVLTAR